MTYTKLIVLIIASNIYHDVVLAGADDVLASTACEL